MKERVNIATVKELLGHKILSMTLRYAHLSKGHKKRAVSVMENVLGKSQLYKSYTIGQNPTKKELTIPAHSFKLSGGADGDRTRDLMTASHARSQLRHSPLLFIFSLLCRFLLSRLLFS
jgi:hypothetical protein